MPLPLRELSVLPNPWALIHPEKGPQGAVPKAPREDGPLRFVGAERKGTLLEERAPNDPRGNRVSITFAYPTLKAGLLDGEPIKVSAAAPDGHYYRDRLVDGSLIPGDERTAKACPHRFASLKDAKAAGVKAFDADHGEGSWDELEKLLADEAKSAVVKPKKSEDPVVIQGSGGGKADGGKG